MSANPLEDRNARIGRGEVIPITAGTSARRRRGEGVIDPRDAFAEAPEYPGGKLPVAYENYVNHCIAGWGGDPGPYACAFLAMNCAALHSTVKVQTNPMMPERFRNPNDFNLTLGHSGEKKSGIYKDLTKFQEEWQAAMSRASSKQVGKGSKFRPISFLQNTSVEGMMMQIADNKGDRLLVASEEAMTFYGGVAAHRKEDANTAMVSTICQVYDGGMFTKRLVNKVFDIPEALATVLMTTVFEKITEWKAFPDMVNEGGMARHTVGLVAYPKARDQDALIPGAIEALRLIHVKLRGLRDVNLVLAENAAKQWLDFGDRKEASIVQMEEAEDAKGLVNWCRKYDMRIMSMAAMFQLYDYVDTGMMNHTASSLPLSEEDAGKGDAPRILKVVEITRDNLSRAIDFVEGYLYDVQEYFYYVADGATTFGKQLVNFMAYRMAIKDTDRHERYLSRGELTNSGPRILKGAHNERMAELKNKWIKALIDHGFIEPVTEVPGVKVRAMARQRRDEEMAWFYIRDEFYEKFEGSYEWAKRHNGALKAKMAESGIDHKRKPLAL